MSEVNTTQEELVEEVSLTVDDAPSEQLTMSVMDADVIPVPIDPTLTIQGEAADAKATGDAIASAVGNVTVNTKPQDANHNITVYGTDISMSSASGAQTVSEAVTAIGNRTANDIIYDSENLVTIKSALDDIYAQIDTELSHDEIDAIIEDVFGGDD